MSTEAPRKAEKGPVVRSVSGPICATCGEPTGLITLNGKTVQVEPKMVVAGEALVITMHRCRLVLEPKPRRKGR